MGSAHLQTRREVRYPLEVEIEVSGVDAEGRAFHERTKTRNVSEWGCAFVSTRKLSVDSILALRAASESGAAGDAPVAIFQVVRVEREESQWLVGVWKFGGADIWGVDLTKLPKPEEGGRNSRRKKPQGCK